MFNKTLLIAALALVSATSALAAEVTPDVSSAPSKLSRADVVAEYVRAKQAGELKHLSGFETATDAIHRAAPARAAQRMPMPDTRRTDVMKRAPDATEGDRTLIPEVVTIPTGKTRAQVVAETREAIRLGVADLGESSAAPSLDQLESIRLAGVRAVAMDVAMEKGAR